MTSRISLSFRSLVALSALVFASSISAEDTKETAEARKARIERAARHMLKCEMRLADDMQIIIERTDRAALVFGDLARGNTNGTLWVYGKTGRPLAFVELYKGIEPNSQWCHAATLTGTRQVVLTTPLVSRWMPETTQIEPVLFPEVATPEAKESLRLRQLKELALKFSAHQFWDPDNSRFELRLLVQPVHRYSDPNAGIQDGAAFVFANGTNPEVIVMIEALGKDVKSSRWHYSFARLGSAEMHVKLDNQEVWKRDRTPGVIGTPRDPYWMFFSPSEAEDDEVKSP